MQLEAKHREGRIFPVELAIQSATTDEGEVFFRTSEGLYTFDEKAGRFERFTRFGRRFGR